jgi:hypothetical protein
MRKLVASNTLKEATRNTRIIEGDVAEAVAKLKEQQRREHPEVRHRRARQDARFRSGIVVLRYAPN